VWAKDTGLGALGEGVKSSPLTPPYEQRFERVDEFPSPFSLGKFLRSGGVVHANTFHFYCPMYYNYLSDF